MTASDDFRRCLEEGDVKAARRLWKILQPNLPQPESDFEVEATLHHARTQASSVRFRLRAWSHRWLVDHGLPSGLPDEMKPVADRLYPRIVEGVGVAVLALSEDTRPLAELVEKSMSDAVAECYADSPHPDPVFVKARMTEARRTTLKKLLG